VEATAETERLPYMRTEVSLLRLKGYVYFSKGSFLGFLLFQKQENKIGCIYWYSFWGNKSLKSYFLVIDSANKRIPGQSSFLS